MYVTTHNNGVYECDDKRNKFLNFDLIIENTNKSVTGNIISMKG